MYCHEICNEDFRLQFYLLIATVALVKLCQFKLCEDLASHSLGQHFCDLFIDFTQNYRIQILKGGINKDVTSLIPVDLHQCNPKVNLVLFLETIL